MLFQEDILNISFAMMEVVYAPNAQRIISTLLHMIPSKAGKPGLMWLAPISIGRMIPCIATIAIILSLQLMARSPNHDYSNPFHWIL
jgi:hypothetical protein